ncbi:MAG: Holliday junction branch migration protein RuvA [Candidatus Nanopelagicaceae bacterium]|jgi:Holliday junction DNA helicase RuvA|nr:Holliday junction branch migration protein RuvA [Candidatus Nanopelagicaceae bacterium]
MIAHLSGSILDVRLNQLVIDVGGIGYQVTVAPELAAESRVGQLISLHTSLVVREDSWTLFGFSNADAKNLFEQLQSVTGIGPKVASALLAVYQPEELRSAIAAQDNAALERVPGIGKKVASRIILELKDKFGGGYRSKSSLSGPWRTQVIGALTGLGYSAKEAESALDDVLSNFGRTPTEADLPEMLKLALAQSRRKS